MLFRSVELKETLAQNLKKQRSLEEKRPDFPKHCTVEEAGLHGELMHHEDEYKAVIDTIRTACINDAAQPLRGLGRPPRRRHQ